LYFPRARRRLRKEGITKNTILKINIYINICLKLILYFCGVTNLNKSL